MITEELKRAVLKAMPATQAEILDKVRIGKDKCRLVLRALKAADRCHVGDWARIGKKPSRIFHAGPGKDVKPPPASKHAQARPERIGNFVKRDPLVAALYGPA